MLSRRVMMASAAAFAAVGCGPLESLFSGPSVPKETELTWVSRRLVGLDDPQQIVATLAADDENPEGSQRGRYRLKLRNLALAPSWDDLNAWRGLEADLLTVSAEEAKVLGENGVLLPLERFSGTDRAALNSAFFPGVLNQFQAQGSLYALPASALPLMVYYDADYFALKQVSPVQGNWRWDELARHAMKLTDRGEDGVVRRWGLSAHSQIWWALWQNEAAMVDSRTLQCRLQEPAAVEAIQFVSGLLHRDRVSPPLLNMDLVRMTPPPAIVYTNPPLRPNYGSYRLAEIPHGKVRAVPVRAGVGVGIAANTEKPEAAFTALKGLVHAMQRHAAVPAGREAIERLGEIQKGLRPEEVTAIQRSMDAEREMPRMPQGAPELYTMAALVEGIVRGDDVSTVVNQACSLLREYQQTGGKTQE